MDNKKGKSVTGILSEGNIGKAVFVFLLLLATTFVVSAQPCDHNVTVLDVCCNETMYNQTSGWFYNGTAWEPQSGKNATTVLFNLSIDGDEHGVFCMNFTNPIFIGNTSNASIYRAEATCKNNSIAYILNNWTIACAPHCANVSAGQSALWYFQYINDTGFCSLGAPQYNHTANKTDPGWESNWIPNCSAHQEACTFINASINQSVPYAIATAPSSGSYPKGTSIPLKATVAYCLDGNRTNVTVVFEADTCTFSENGSAVYETNTTNGIANATLDCNVSVDSVKVTVRVKDMKWFGIVDPTGCPGDEFQETLRIVNITGDANFNFYTDDTPRVPVLTPLGIAALIGLLSWVVVLSIRKKGKRG